MAAEELAPPNPSSKDEEDESSGSEGLIIEITKSDELVPMGTVQRYIQEL